MCGAVKLLRVECGPMHCGLPGKAISEVHQHSAVCQVGGRVGAVAQANPQGLAAGRKSDGAAAAACKSGLGHDGPPCGIRRFPAHLKVQPLLSRRFGVMLVRDTPVAVDLTQTYSQPEEKTVLVRWVA
jgi:hypothetical protein